MSDPAITKALLLRDGLAQEINTLVQRTDEKRRELAQVESFISMWGKLSGQPVQTELSTAFKNLARDVPRDLETKSFVRNSKKEDVAAAARDLISGAGRPLSREELFPLLRERGLVIQGNDPQMVLSTMLWRMKDEAKITRLKGGGYWLAEKDWPQVGYYPNERLAPQHATAAEAMLKATRVITTAAAIDRSTPAVVDDDVELDEIGRPIIQ